MNAYPFGRPTVLCLVVSGLLVVAEVIGILVGGLSALGWLPIVEIGRGDQIGWFGAGLFFLMIPAGFAALWLLFTFEEWRQS